MLKLFAEVQEHITNRAETFWLLIPATRPLSLCNTEHIPTEVSEDKECILGKLGPTRNEEYTLATEMDQKKTEYINEYI